MSQGQRRHEKQDEKNRKNEKNKQIFDLQIFGPSLQISLS